MPDSIFNKSKYLVWIACAIIVFSIFILSSQLNALHSPEYIAAKGLDLPKFTTGTREINMHRVTTSTLEPSARSVETQNSSESEKALVSDATSAAPETTLTNALASGTLTVHYLNVGQADCILIRQGTSSMLIDAGNNADADLVVSYLRDQGLNKLDYVIGTHPHEDHIGGLDAVIDSFQIGKIILPNAGNTTETFEDVLNAVRSNGLKITRAVPGAEYALGQADVKILGPALSTFDDLNDASVVCKVTFGTTSFLFEGDAETASESAMLSQGFDLETDVVKIGHHGSSSSTNSAFLKAVSPEYAVISVGQGNDYGHPTAQTLTRLKNAGIKLFRTDLAGTVIAKSDGQSIQFNTKPSYGTAGQTQTAETTVRPATQATTQSGSAGSTTVYITNTGSKYHRDGCQYLSKSNIAISESDAIERGYEPCSRCKP